MFERRHGADARRRRSRGTRFGAVAAAVAVLTAVASALAPATADTLGPIDFEPPGYTGGNINGQQGWSKTGAYDSEVAGVAAFPNANGFGFGQQALRISDAVTTGGFGDQTFSPPLAEPAGEGTAKHHLVASFSLGSALATLQPGMHISISPDSGEGSRMSYLRFEDQADGIHIFFDDATDPGPVGTVANFSDTYIGTIDRTSAHTALFDITFVNGPANDVVKIYIDGSLKITGTTWEDYYRYDPEQTPTGNMLRPVEKLLFREGGAPDPLNSGNGFLFDNVSMKSSDVSTGTALSMGPQAMEGALKVKPGDVLKAGYDFTIPGRHDSTDVTFHQPQVSFVGSCVSGGAPVPLTVSMSDATINDPANSSSWYPSGDQHSVLVFQGQLLVPHGSCPSDGPISLAKGGTFTAGVSATAVYKVNVRWHYSANGSAGGWSGTKSVTPTMDG